MHGSVLPAGRRMLLSLLGMTLLSLLTGCGATVVSAATNAAPAQAALVFRGSYNAASSYAVNDVVLYQGSSYVAIAASTNMAPSGGPASATGWVMLAAAGALGPAGPQGAAGPQGLTGAQGPTGPTGAQGPTGARGPDGLQGVRGITGAAGTAGPAGPAGVAGPSGPTGPQGPAGTPGQAGTTVLSGRRLGVLGDSISTYSLFGNAWQNVVLARTGMTLAVQDARPGRRFDQALECWGNPAPGGTPGTFNAGYLFPTTAGTCGSSSTGLTDGMTFAASLAPVDIEVIELGTNDRAIPLGQPGDATNAGTFYGNVRWIVETYLAAKPTLRLVLVTPEYTTLQPTYKIQQDTDALVAYGSSMGVPVINMYTLGGVNPVTLSSLLRDGVHPSDFAFQNIYGPVIAQHLQMLF